MRFALLLLLLLPLPAWSSTQDPAGLCEWAARQAAAESNVPLDILAALTLTETGRRRDGSTRPWAWSVNASGKGQWFDDPRSALTFAEHRVSSGQTNLDIGCFQLNYRWHGQHFASIAEMFDPLTNARYAARFVQTLHAELGDWRKAAGAFHSRTPEHAQRYLARFDEFRAMLQNASPERFASGAETYNRFVMAEPSEAVPSEQPNQAVPMVERRMLLGAPIGSPRTGMPGTLAVLNVKQARLLSTPAQIIDTARGPLIGPGARHVSLPRERRRNVSDPLSPIPEVSEEAFDELITEPPVVGRHAAAIPNGGAPRQELFVPGETPL